MLKIYIISKKKRYEYRKELKFEFNKDSYLGLLIFCQYFLFLPLIYCN